PALAAGLGRAAGAGQEHSQPPGGGPGAAGPGRPATGPGEPAPLPAAGHRRRAGSAPAPGYRLPRALRALGGSDDPGGACRAAYRPAGAGTRGPRTPGPMDRPTKG